MHSTFRGVESWAKVGVRRARVGSGSGPGVGLGLGAGGRDRVRVRVLGFASRASLQLRTAL